MGVHQDFVDLLQEFAVSEVKYLVVGGADDQLLELLLDAGDANIMRACSALRAFGAPAQVIVNLSRAADDEIVWMGSPHSPRRVAFRRRFEGADFAATAAKR